MEPRMVLKRTSPVTDRGQVRTGMAAHVRIPRGALAVCCVYGAVTGGRAAVAAFLSLPFSFMEDMYGQ